MRRLGRIVAGVALALVLLIGGAVAWYKVNYPTTTYRYRMTVEVQVDGEVRSGSSVIEVSIARQPQFGSAPPYVPRTRGEAVFVDLGKGRNVIALLAAGPRGENVNYTDSIVPLLFNVPFEQWEELPDLRGSREVPPAHLPTFVTFADLNDPKSARVVAPDNFEQVFGPDVHFKRVEIEIASERVTSGIDKKIPWIGNYTLETAFERSCEPPIADSVHR